LPFKTVGVFILSAKKVPSPGRFNHWDNQHQFLRIILKRRDHLGDRHFQLVAKPHSLFQVAFKPGHLCIKRCAIKFKVSRIAMLLGKGIAPRRMDNRLIRRLKFMGNSMQPTDHGPVSIKNTLAIEIERAYMSPDHLLFIRRGVFFNYL